ncbi:cupin domain-containing protein [Actinomadura geliboluensis]|uniref:cupin domain-containing protein n=1 Tax=Actinomadura geliboluensis TaxID=882440 RepID=UPI0037246664
MGGIAVVRGDVPYTVADDPATTPSLEVTSGDYCSAAEGASGSARTCGTPVDGAPVLLSGAFERRGELSERLLGPPPFSWCEPRTAPSPRWRRSPRRSAGPGRDSSWSWTGCWT